MKAWKKSIHKVITLAMIVNVLSPIVLSTGVSAVEGNSVGTEDVESNVLSEVELQKDSVLLKEEQIESAEDSDAEIVVEEDYIE